MWFKLKPYELNGGEKAPEHFYNEVKLPASPEKIFKILAGNDWDNWFKDFVSVSWDTPDNHGVGSKRQVKLKTLSARETMLAWEPGKRFSFTLTEVTLPLVHAMMEDMQLEETADGGTLLKWYVHYDPNLFTKIFHPVVRGIFGNMFRKSMKNLVEFCQK